MVIMILLPAILVLIGIAFHYFTELEDAEAYIFRLESKPHELKEENKRLKAQMKDLEDFAYQAGQRATKHFSKLEEISNAISENQYDSVINLQNKLKSILDNSDSSNIE